MTRCTGITVWGVRDTDSWRTGENPLLFDSKRQQKAAYTSTLAALNAVAPTTPPTTPTPTVHAHPHPDPRPDPRPPTPDGHHHPRAAAR